LANLFHLIRFALRVLRLKVQDLLNSITEEDVMAALILSPNPSLANRLRMAEKEVMASALPRKTCSSVFFHRAIRGRF